MRSSGHLYVTLLAQPIRYWFLIDIHKVHQSAAGSNVLGLGFWLTSLQELERRWVRRSFLWSFWTKSFPVSSFTLPSPSSHHLAISSSISLTRPSRSPRNFLDAHLMTISSLAHLHFLEMQICGVSERETTLPAVPGNYALVTWQEHECWMATASFKLQAVWIQELFVCLSRHGEPSRWKFCSLVLASPTRLPINTFAAQWSFFRHLTRWHLQVKLFK